MPGPKRFTVFDMMEAKGVFAENPANMGSQTPDGQVLYRGPVQYPKMLYHPKGERRLISPGEEIVTAFGPKVINRHFEIITRTVHTEAEEAEALAEGWHKHPAHAIAAGGGEAPPISADSRIKDLEAQIKALQAERDFARQNEESLRPLTAAKK